MTAENFNVTRVAEQKELGFLRGCSEGLSLKRARKKHWGEIPLHEIDERAKNPVFTKNAGGRGVALSCVHFVNGPQRGGGATSAASRTNSRGVVKGGSGGACSS